MLDEATTVEPRAPIRMADGGVLDPLVGPQCSLAVQLRRANGAVIGRTSELDAIAQELREASTRLAAVTLEGEPGIGKTRLLLAAADLAATSGFACVVITADEEIRGPFLVAQSLFASNGIRDTAAGTPAEAVVTRVVDAISGRDAPGFETRSADAKLLRAFDLASVAISTLAGIKPLALFVDDVQWADDDTLRLLRYVVRSDADRPIFLFLTIRPDEFATVSEAVNFVADMERMGLVRRLRPGRFSSVETAELLKRVLGGPVEPASATAMHVQSEGVPFIVEELARTHREAGTLQQIDGTWRLGRNAARLVPSAVRTLIDRRAARLPAPTRAALGDAAILGRSFSLRDLRAIQARIGPGAAGSAVTAGETDQLADDLAPAVQAGLLLPQAAGEPADYTFTHEQVRQFAAAQLSAARRRQVHAAVVDLLLEGGDPGPAGLPMLAQHALAADDTVRAAHFSIDAATAALASNAPEEALRLVEQALPVVSSPDDRRILLATRDDAFAVLRKTDERLEGLAELAALAEAMRDPAIEIDVQLRRASALRMNHDEDEAAELARRALARAAGRGDAATELRATLELGQALLRTPIGESLGAVAIEVDLDAAESAYRRAIELAEQVGDDRSLAAALRENAMIQFARARSWFADEMLAGRGMPWLEAVTAGGDVEELLLASDIGPYVSRGRRRPRASARDLRADRRPDRRHVDGHRHGLCTVWPGDAPDGIGATSRGDPAGHEPSVRAGHRERARPAGPPDAVRGPRLFAGQGGAGPGAVPRRGCPSGGQAAGRPDDRVPGRGRRGDGPARARRPRGCRAMARQGRGGDLLGTVPKPLHPARDVARDGPGRLPGTRMGCAAISSRRSRWRPRQGRRPRGARRWPAWRSRLRAWPRTTGRHAG